MVLWLLCRLFHIVKEFYSELPGGSNPGPGPGSLPGQSPTIAPFDTTGSDPRSDLTQKVSEVKALLLGDPFLAQKLCQFAGISIPPAVVASDREAVEAIARQVSWDQLRTLSVANNQRDIKFDLQKQTKVESVNYPTALIEPISIPSMDRVPDVLPEEMALDDEQFFYRLATGELTVLQAYDKVESGKVLEILIDVSPSMNEAMKDGLNRHNWARGVAASLLVEAVRGEATFIIRTFDNAAHSPRFALNQEQAEEVLDFLLNLKVEGNGTNIFAAFSAAVDDIQKRLGDTDIGDILIISDGEDESMSDSKRVKALLGDKINLHVAMIGGDNPALQEVATDYRVYNK